MSIINCFYEPDDGLIELYLGAYRGSSGYDTSSLINIRYKGIETDIKNRNYQISPNYHITNDHIMYDIKHTTYNKKYNTETHKIDEFYIINTNIIIRISKIIDTLDEGIININLNGLSITEFPFKNESVYHQTISIFKMILAEIQNEHLNSVNMANFTLPNNIKGSIGTFLTGQNGSIAQQRTMVQQQQQEQEQEQENRLLESAVRGRTSFVHNDGGQRKSCKSRKSRKSRKK
jgi:hypothetical protein